MKLKLSDALVVGLLIALFAITPRTPEDGARVLVVLGGIAWAIARGIEHIRFDE